MIVRAIWQALGLDLPPRRRPHLMRFFIGLKPLQPIAYASLLRAIARALLETGLVPVGRDARYDPIELIAAAVEVSVARWDREVADEVWPALTRIVLWNDLAIRAAAFETLFRCRARRELVDAALAALARAIGGEHDAPFATALDRARVEVTAMIASKPEYADAMLAESVVVGASSAIAVGCEPKALGLARGLALVRAERFVEALAVFESILDRVPGHALALQQAARCCIECGALSRAHEYSRRMSRRVESRRGNALRYAVDHRR
jgi:hypothetical protein